jgi:hypothetical protein
MHLDSLRGQSIDQARARHSYGLTLRLDLFPELLHTSSIHACAIHVKSQEMLRSSLVSVSSSAPVIARPS